MTEYKTANHKGIEYKYLEFGFSDNPPLVLLHGYAGAASVYAPIMEVLSEDYHVFGLDLPMRANKDTIYSLSDLVNYVAGFLDSLSLNKVELMGFSLGGFVATHVLFAFPDRISAIHILNSSVYLDFTKLQSYVFKFVRRFKGNKKFLENASKVVVSPIVRTFVGKTSLGVFVSRTIRESPVSTLGTVIEVIDEMYNNREEILARFVDANCTKRIILFRDDVIFPYDAYAKLYSTEEDLELISLEPGGHCVGQPYMDTLCNYFAKETK